MAGPSGKDRARARNRGGEPIDLLERVVERERGASGGGNFEELHHRHGAMVAGPNGDAVLVENGAEIVGMHALDHERDQARLLAGRADDPSPSILLKVRVAWSS